MLTQPGIALVQLIKSGGDHVLRELIDESLLQLLEAEGTSSVNSTQLENVLDQLIDPVEILNQTRTRERIVDLLPISKARELADRLNVKADKNIYRSLKIASSNPSVRSTLDSFFGVVRQFRQPKPAHPTTAALQPQYGLYDHQRDAASRVERFLKSGSRKAVLHMPTGSGKTRTSMHIVASHLREKRPAVVCWLAYSAELLEQAASEFEKAWGHLGDRPIQVIRFWGNSNTNLLELKDGIVIAGLSKVHALDVRDPSLIPRFADRASLIVVDEAHQSIAPTYESIIDSLYTKQPENALLGLTATPGRTWSDIAEDRKLSEKFSRRKVTLRVEGYPSPIEYLISEGYLAKPVFRQLDGQAQCLFSPSEQKDLLQATDIPTKFLDKLGRDVSRNRVVLSEVKNLMRRHHRTLVFAPSVESAFNITFVLRTLGLAAEVLTGKTPTVERESIIRRFCSPGGQPRAILNFGVLTTGFDAPATSAAVIARPTKSLVLYSQMVGRATRGPKVDGNATAEIVTVVDTNLPGFGSISQAFANWEDVWHEDR